VTCIKIFSGIIPGQIDENIWQVIDESGKICYQISARYTCTNVLSSNLVEVANKYLPNILPQVCCRVFWLRLLPSIFTMYLYRNLIE
jgi:hypothetical protein